MAETDAISSEKVTKQQKAQWKKNLKLLKLKDPQKKLEGIQSCLEDHRFFREGGAIPILFGLLTRLKNTEVLSATVSCFLSLLQNEDEETAKMNAQQILEEGVVEKSSWKAGEMFINLFENTHCEISLDALQVYSILLQRAIDIPRDNKLRDAIIEQIKTAGNPIKHLLPLCSSEEVKFMDVSIKCLNSVCSPINEQQCSTLQECGGIDIIVNVCKNKAFQFELSNLSLVNSLSNTGYGRDCLVDSEIIDCLNVNLQDLSEELKSVKDISQFDNRWQILQLICESYATLICSSELKDKNLSLADMTIDGLKNLVSMICVDKLKCNICVACCIIQAVGQIIEDNEEFKQAVCENGFLHNIYPFWLLNDIENKLQLRGLIDKCFHICIRCEDQVRESVLSSSIDDGINGKLNFLKFSDISSLLNSEIEDTILKAGILLKFGIDSNAMSTYLVRIVHTIMDKTSNIKAFGVKGSALLLRILRTHTVEFTLDNSERKELLYYLVKCIDVLCKDSSDVCEACGIPENCPVVPLLKLVIDESSDVDLLKDAFVSLYNPLDFSWASLSSNSIENGVSNDNPTKENLYKNIRVAAASTLCCLAGSVFRWNSQVDRFCEDDFEYGKNDFKNAKKKSLGGKKAENCSYNCIGISKEVVSNAFRLIKSVSRLSETTDTSAFLELEGLRIAVLEILHHVAKCPAGIQSLLEQAQKELPSTSNDEGRGGKSISHYEEFCQEWPINTIAEVIESPYLYILNPICKILNNNLSSLNDICAAFGFLESLIYLEKPSAESVHHIEIFSNVAAANGILLTLISLLDVERLTPCEDNCTKYRNTPNTPDDINVETCDNSGEYERIGTLKKRLEIVVLYLIRLGSCRQAALQSSYEESLESTPPNEEELKEKPFDCEEKWISILNQKFTFTRFNFNSYSPLLAAISGGFETVAQILLQAGVSSNTTDNDGTSPLMLALARGCFDLADILLEYDADVDAINSSEENVLKYCFISSNSIKKYEEVVKDSIIGFIPQISGKPSSLQKILQNNVDPNISDSDGNFPLHWAVSDCHTYTHLKGNLVCLQYDSNCAEICNEFVFETVEKLMNYKADINVCNKAGRTPLHLAIINDHLKVADFLLKNGANPNIYDVDGRLPLHYACGSPWRDRVNTIQLIISSTPHFALTKGSHVDNRKGKTKKERVSFEVDELFKNSFHELKSPSSLCEQKATVHQVVNFGDKYEGLVPIHFASGAKDQYYRNTSAFSSCKSSAAKCSSSKCFSACENTEQGELQSNESPTTDEKKCTTNGDIDVITILESSCKENEFNINKSSRSGFNCLHFAAMSDNQGSNSQLIDFLADNGTCIDQVHDNILINSTGLTKFSVGMSVVVFNEESQKNEDARIVYTNSEGTVFDLIQEDGNFFRGIARDLINPISPSETLMLDSEFAFSPLHYALQNNDEVALKFLQLGANPSSEGSDLPVLPLACAANRSAEIISRLISPHVNTRVHLSNKYDGTALHFLASNNSVETIEMLLRHESANANIKRPTDSFTPLHIACELENISMIQLLMKFGADLTTTRDECSPLSLIVSKSCNALLKDIIDLGLLEGCSIDREVLLAEEKNTTLVDNMQNSTQVDESLTLEVDKSNHVVKLLLNQLISEDFKHIHECFEKKILYMDWISKEENFAHKEVTPEEVNTMNYISQPECC